MPGEIIYNSYGGGNSSNHTTSDVKLNPQRMEMRILEGTPGQGVLPPLGLDAWTHQFSQLGLDMDLVYKNIAGGWDNNGFLTKDWSAYIERVWDANGTGKNEIINSIGEFNVGIWCNVITADGGYEICADCNPEGDYYQEALEARQEYRIYSTVQRFNANYPRFTDNSNGSARLTDLTNYPTISTDGLASAYMKHENFSIEMHPNEKTGFSTKYGMLSGVNTEPDSYDNRVEIAAKFIDDKMAAMAADIYQTIISREYVPNVITKKKSLIDIKMSTKLGTERPPDLDVGLTSTAVLSSADGSSITSGEGTSGGGGMGGGGSYST